MEDPATVSLNRETRERLGRLAAIWRVTPEEALSRAVERVAATTADRPYPVENLRKLHEAGGGLDPAVADAHLEEVREDRHAALEMLRAYHAKGGLDPATADAWIEEIREDRQRWRGE